MENLRFRDPLQLANVTQASQGMLGCYPEPLRPRGISTMHLTVFSKDSHKEVLLPILKILDLVTL